MTNEKSEYDAAWNEGEAAPAPLVSAAKSAAQAERDRQAKEFSEEFFKDEQAAEASDVKPVANAITKTEGLEDVQSDEAEQLAADAKAKAA